MNGIAAERTKSAPAHSKRDTGFGGRKSNRLYPRALPAIDQEEHDRLFTSIDTRMTLDHASHADFWATDLCVLSRDPEIQNDFSFIRNTFQSMSLCDTVQTVLSFGSHCDPECSLFAIDMEGAVPGMSIVPELMMIRQSFPRLPILIMSRKFKRNDFSLERRMIADASLRIPAKPTVLLEALGMALNNTRSRLRFG